MFWVQWFGLATQYLSQSVHTFLPAWWALVDVGHAAGDGLCIAGAIGVATALALGLGQGVQHLLSDIRHTTSATHADHVTPGGHHQARARGPDRRAGAVRDTVWVARPAGLTALRGVDLAEVVGAFL